MVEKEKRTLPFAFWFWKSLVLWDVGFPERKWGKNKVNLEFDLVAVPIDGARHNQLFIERRNTCRLMVPKESKCHSIFFGGWVTILGLLVLSGPGQLTGASHLIPPHLFHPVCLPSVSSLNIFFYFLSSLSAILLGVTDCLAFNLCHIQFCTWSVRRWA